MSRRLQELSREQLSRSLREARERKEWTLEQLARELWVRGFPTSQNKLWRLENKPPKRVDTELLLWLEKVQTGRDPVAERHVLALVRLPGWGEQRAVWRGSGRSKSP